MEAERYLENLENSNVFCKPFQFFSELIYYLKASPAVLYAVGKRPEAVPVARCGTVGEPTTMALPVEVWTALEQGGTASTPEGSLMPVADEGGVCGILALGHGPPNQESQRVWQLCRNFLCKRLRVALGPSHVRVPPNPKTVWFDLEAGLSVTGGLVSCDSLVAQKYRDGEPTLPELIRNQTLVALRELLGPRDSLGVLPSGDIWFLLVTATPPDLDLVALTVAESLAERLLSTPAQINPCVRLIPGCTGAEEFFQP